MFWRFCIKYLIFGVFFWGFVFSSIETHAQSSVVYQDDFEAGVSGWSNNDTDFAPAVSNFLGRFAVGNTETSRIFTLPSNTEELRIEFDLYRFDSWDNFAQFGFDRFEIEIDGVEIFSLAFPNPQDMRSGSVGNVSWSHTPLTGREELGFTTGQFWFDQLHRFVLIVENPGASVELKLRADLSQQENDESAGYDNFLITAFTDGNGILAVAENFAAINGDIGGMTPSVLSSDLINGMLLDPADVVITNTSSSDPDVTLDVSTGLITVAPNTPFGTFIVDYEICDIVDLTNCSTVTETIEVFTSLGSPSNCPAGTTQVSGSFHVVSASGGNNPNRAIGPPIAEGTVVDPNNDVAVTFFPTITLDLTGDPEILIPEGEIINLALSSFFGNNARAEILMSVDDNTYISLGTTGNGGSVFGAWTSNTLRYDGFTVPVGGARYVQISHESGGVISDGVIYNNQCQIMGSAAELNAVKSVSVYDPDGLDLYAVPGNDVIYTFTIQNTGDGDVDSGSLFLVDAMPSELAFYNGDIDDGGPENDPVTFQDTSGGVSLDFNTDVGFSNGVTSPSSFSDCSYIPVNGYDEDVSFICFNPQGVMAGNSSLRLSFRSRIL